MARPGQRHEPEPMTKTGSRGSNGSTVQRFTCEPLERLEPIEPSRRRSFGAVLFVVGMVLSAATLPAALQQSPAAATEVNLTATSVNVSEPGTPVKIRILR